MRALDFVGVPGEPTTIPADSSNIDTLLAQLEER